MKLVDVLKNINIEQTIGSQEKEVAMLTLDSRENIVPNSLYFAVIGTSVDGHDYINDVIKKGATTIVCSNLPVTRQDNITYIVVKNVAKQVGLMASNFYHNPSQRIKIIAITGTNGKTSVANFLSQSLQFLGKKTLLLSTAGDYFDNSLVVIERKAPSSLEIIELHRVLSQYLDQGLEYCCLEATSIGLDQHRLSGIDIDYAVFTNLSDDHLDYHGTMINYANAKRRLFDELKPIGVALSNRDDDYGPYMLENTTSSKKYFGTSDADYIFDVKKMNLYGLELSINKSSVQVPVVGEFNAYNITAVFSILSEIGFSGDEIIKSFSNIRGIPGRMQMIKNNKQVLALVDYAHTGDAIDNVLRTLQLLPHNKIITVIGCGGDRDRIKRPTMAQISQQYSDYVVYTADNPRTENLEQIFDDMKEGIDTNNNNYFFIPKREEAIKKSVELSQANDIILIAGKGHENYQIIGTEKKHFDDREVLSKYLSI